MGTGKYTTNSFTARKLASSAAGYSSTFMHDEDIKSGRKAFGVAERLDPTITNKNGEHAGKNIREAMDSDEHPNATPIMVWFDVTGSMGGIPKVLQEKLPQLHGVLQRKGYVEDPQICFGAIGDAYSDRAPIQVGQFESDNRMDDDLSAMVLEGGGGGGCHESYELAIYYAARHTHLDIAKKRNGKGYLFIIGDERVYRTVNAEQVRGLIGGVSSEVTDNMPTLEIVREAQEKWEIFFLFAEEGSYDAETVLGGSFSKDSRNSWAVDRSDNAMGWRELLGQNAIVLEKSEAVCEFIALTLGVMEGTVTLDDGMEDLKETGSDETSVVAAGKALAMVGGGGGSMATTSGDLPGLEAEGDDEGGAERL